MRHGGALQDAASVIRQRIEGAGAHSDIEPTWLKMRDYAMALAGLLTDRLQIYGKLRLGNYEGSR